MSAEASFWGKYRTLILFLLSLVIGLALAYIFRSVLLPFIIGLILAYLISPLIRWVEQRVPPKNKWRVAKRALLIILAFILVTALLVLFIIYIYYGVRDSFLAFISQVPQYLTGGMDNMERWFQSVLESTPSQYQQGINDIVNNLSGKVGELLQGIFKSGIGMIPGTVGMLAGFLSLPFFLFFLLMDAESLWAGFYASIPSALAIHARNIFKIIDNVVGKYIRAQLVLGSVIAVLVFIGLSVLGIKLAPALAVFAGLMELIPVIGPWIGGILGVLVTLAVAPDKIIWVAVVYVVANLLENVLLVPRIQGSFLHINPAILMVVLVLGASLGGILGMVVAAPMAALIFQIYKYVRSSSAKDKIAQAAG